MPDKKEVYVFRKDPSGYKVLKLCSSSSEVPSIASEYTIVKTVNGELACNCPGFVHRGNCKHSKMLEDKISGNKVSLAEARSIVSGLIAAFRAAFSRISLPDEPYERDESGMVCRINLLLRGPLFDPCILSKGIWEGKLEKSGLVTRFIVE
jgi:hypothetical protein